jgi:hypothetical protein
MGRTGSNGARIASLLGLRLHNTPHACSFRRFGWQPNSTALEDRASAWLHRSNAFARANMLFSFSESCGAMIKSMSWPKMLAKAAAHQLIRTQICESCAIRFEN